MSDEQNVKPELQDNTQPVNANPSDELSEDELNDVSGGTLTVRKAGKEQQEYYKVTMSDVLISSYQTGGSEG